MAGEKQPEAKLAKPAGGKAFVIPQASYKVTINKNIPVVVAAPKKPTDNKNKSASSAPVKANFVSNTHEKLSKSDKKSFEKNAKDNKSKQEKSKTVVKKNWWEMETSYPIVTFPEEQPWYNQYPSFVEEYIASGSIAHGKIDEKQYQAIQQHVESNYNAEVVAHLKAVAAAGKGNSDQKWINDVIKSGTLSDKVAALALRIQESPFHQIETLDAIVAMALKKEQRTSQLALEAVKDLLINNLLPDRKLVAFKTSLLMHPQMTLSTALLLYYESQLKTRVERLMEALENGLKSNVDYFKKVCLETAASLLMSKPEQEARLLTMITNKLGDAASKTSSKCIETLKQILHVHPAMKGVVVREVRQFIYKPHNKLKSIFNGVLFLSQVPLKQGDHDVAAQLVECYVSLFEKAVKEDELGSRLLSALLTGINRSFQYLEDVQPIVKYADSLFRLVHTASFTSSTQALMLLSHLAIANTSDSTDGKKNGKDAKKARSKATTKAGSDEGSDSEEKEEEAGEGQKTEKDIEADAGNDLTRRYYRALYAKLLSDQVTTRAKNTLLLNLLYRSIKKDPSSHRAMAFLKRLSICATHSSPSIAAGLLFLISEVLDSRPALKKMLDSPEEASFQTTQAEHLAVAPQNEEDDDEAAHQLGNFDASKREPEYAATARPSLWEVSLMRRHFHPSVQAFAHTLLDAESGHHINFAGDPTTDFSLMAFLNRFAYKNPKKSVADKLQQQRKSLVEEPINESKFIRSDESEVAPDKQFFHKYFGEREQLREEGKSRDRSAKRRHKRDSDDEDEEGDSDDEAAGSEADEAEIDEFANKLAEDLMREHDAAHGHPDMDDFSEDEEGDSDDSEVYDNPDAFSDDDEEEEGSDDASGDDEEEEDEDSEMDLDEPVDSDEELAPPAKKGGKTSSSKSAALDLADFVKESSNSKQKTAASKSDKKSEKKSAKKGKAAVESDSDDDGYTGLVAYNEDEDEDLKKPAKIAAKGSKKDARAPAVEDKKAASVKKDDKQNKKASKKATVAISESENSDGENDDDSDMDAVEFDEDGNADNFDSDEDLDLIMRGDNDNFSAGNSKKSAKKGGAEKRKRGGGGGDGDFAAAEDYEAEMENILQQIQQAKGGAAAGAGTGGKTGRKNEAPASKKGKAVPPAPTSSNKKSRK